MTIEVNISENEYFTVTRSFSNTTVGKVYKCTGVVSRYSNPSILFVDDYNKDSSVSYEYVEKVEPPLQSQFASQVGGEHYAKQKIQPLQYILANELDFCQGNVVKYVTRFRDKNGAEDLKKVIQYAQFLLEDDYGILSNIEYGEGNGKKA